MRNVLGEDLTRNKKDQELCSALLVSEILLLKLRLLLKTWEIGLEVNVDKTKHMVTSRGQNAGRSQNMRIDNRSFERVEEFKYLGTTLTNQNSVQEEIKSRLKLGNVAIIRCRTFCLPVCYAEI